LRVVRTIVLARLLSPDDFGLMGIAILAINMLETFSQTGIETALVHKKENIEAYLDIAWTIQVTRSVILFVLLYFGAPLVAHFFNSPQALRVVRILAFLELFRGMKNIGTVYFQKELRFDKQFVLGFSGIAVNIAVSLTLAFVLRNVWALVYGSLSGAFVVLIMSYILQPYKPRIRLETLKIKELLDFGKWLLGSSILGFLITQGDDIFVGKLLGITALGLYQIAYHFSNAPATEITHVISRVTFPVYSKIQDNIPRLRDAYFNVLQLTASLSFPLAALIFVMAADFTKIFLGDKWMSMVPAMRVLAIWGLIRSVGATAGPFFYAIGRPKVIAKLQFLQLILLISTIYPLTVKWGILGTSLSVVFAALVPNLAVYYMVTQALGCRYYDFWRMVLLPGFGIMTMYIVLMIVRVYISGAESIANFFVMAILGLAVYMATIIVLDRLSNRNISRIIQEYLFDPIGRFK
ncbi:MAG: lipopolysaccharide biosynthesis protein, partial [Candidatus Omnitrophota bacterium]